MGPAKKTKNDIQGSSGNYRPSSERPPFVALGRTGTRRKGRMPKALKKVRPIKGEGVAGRL